MTTSYLIDWSGFLLRWLHIVTAIAWIGTSFHFVLTDDRLYRPTDPDLLAKGVDGESWAVHGGGFYHFNKYRIAPAHLPARLHWSFWEAYSTWLSGFALLTVVYFANAATYLVDPRILAWSSTEAIAGAVAFLVVGWIVYDGICRSAGRDRNVGALVFLYVCVASWAACHLFAGRAAFLLTGAMLATLMSANVAMVIIPGQRRVVAALRDGRPPDPRDGQRGRQRSVHNTYLTLPVIVAMISNHAGTLTQGPWNWLALLALMSAGALIRLFFVLRHRGPSRWELALPVAALIGFVTWMQRPAEEPVPDTATATFPQVVAIIDARCVMCHDGVVANKGVRLDSAAAIVAHARDIEQQAVLQKTMPLNNATGITDAERATLGRWVAAGARP